jgi:hypothetical protein
MQEDGVQRLGVDLRFWFALFGPKGARDAVKAKLESEIRDWTKFIDEKGIKPE